MSEQPHDTEHHVRRLAQALGERYPKPMDHIRRIVAVMGGAFADEVLRETQAVKRRAGYS